MKYLKQFIGLTLAVIVALSYPHVSVSQDTSPNGWKQIKEDKKEHWKIYRRSVNGSENHEYKITTELNASVLEAREAAKNLIINPKYYLSNKGKEYGWFKILEENPNGFILYSLMYGPGFMKDRDVVLAYELYESSDHSTAGIRWHQTSYPGYEEKKDVIRMPVDIGDWQFRQITSEKCEVTHTLQFHPGGKISRGMINMMIKTRLPEELLNLKEEVSLIQTK